MHIKLFAIIFMLSLLSNKNSFAQNTAVIKSVNLADSVHESKTIPAFEFYTLTDSTLFTPKNLERNTPILFIYFNTECDHCQHEVKSLQKYIDYFKGVQIIFVSREPLQKIQEFYEKYEMKNFPFTVLWDKQNKIHDWFDFEYIPMIRQYNKKGKLIAAYNEQATVYELYENFK